jgi:PilZ domain-containing protein
MRQEKRLHRRYAVRCELKGKALNQIATGDVDLPANRDISGEVADIGAGGLCLLTNDRAEVSDPVLCEVRSPHMPVGIPTLMQVRWAVQNGTGHTYRLGLQFLV